MITTMNDQDFEEKLLLNSLSDCNNHHHQHPYLGMTNTNTNTNTNINANNNNTNYYHSHHHHNTHRQQQYFEHENSHQNYHLRQQQHCEQHWNESSNIASTVSMSTEEDTLDNFNLFDDDQPEMDDITSDNLDVRMTFSIESTTQKADKLPKSSAPKRSRRMASDDVDKEHRSCPKQQPKQRKVNNQKNKHNSKENHITNEGAQVEEPTDSDVLCGQSRTCSNHPGNKHFQGILDEFAHRYDIATSKQEKMCMTKEIVSIVHNSGGRFLRLQKNKTWEEISTVAARDKVSHALRTKAASRKRRQEQMQQGDNRRGYLPSSPTSKSPSPSRSRSCIKLHRRGSRNRRSSDPSVSTIGSSEITPIPFDGKDTSSSSSVMDGLLKFTSDMFTTLTKPGITAPHTSTNHRRRHSQPNPYDAEDFNEHVPLHRSDSAPFRQLRY